MFLAYPVLNTLTASFWGEGRSGWATIVAEPIYAQSVLNTVLLGLSVTAVSLLLAVPLAWIVARFDFPGKAVVAVLPLVPLMIPEVISAQTWLMILGNNGLLTRFLAEHNINLPSFYGWPGLIVTLSATCYAYLYVSILPAIQGFDMQMEQAAQSLGTSPIESRLRVVLPLIMPAILAGALLVFSMVAGDFVTATILAGPVPLLSVLTYQATVSESQSDPMLQSALASLSIALLLLVVLVQRAIIARGHYEMVQCRMAVPQRLRGASGVGIGLAVSAIIIVSILPLVTLAAGAFTQARGPVMHWGKWTTANIEHLFLKDPNPLVNSLIYAFVATILSIAFSVLFSYLIVKKQNRLTPLIDGLTALPLALSGTVIGISLVTTFNTGWLQLTGTATIIVLAYIIRRLPLGIRSASATLCNVPNSIEEASISLGVAPVASFFKAVLPLMLPAIAAAAVLTWTTTVAELSASIVVYSGGRETLPIQIYQLIDSGLMAQASANGLALILIIGLPVFIATKLFRVDLFSLRN